MKIDLQGNTKLSFFKDLYEDARAKSDVIYEKLDTYYEQYKGSPKIDVSDVEAKQVRNITYELIESQVTSYIPTPSVTPKMWSEQNERNAKSIETLLRNKRNELKFEKMNDMDERFNPIYGGSVWLIEWDNSITTHNTVGDVRISCLSPKRFTGQPNIYEVADMEYCFIQFETTKEELVRKYGVTFDVADEAENDDEADDKTATLYICYYKNDQGKVCQYVWSGETELSDIEDYFARKRYICKKCGKRKELCNCEEPEFELANDEYEEVKYDIKRSDGSFIPAQSEVIKDGQVVMEMKKEQAIDESGQLIFDDSTGVMLPLLVDVSVPKMEPTKLPFYTPNILPIVVRKNTSEEDNLFGQSDCAFIRPQQQATNKIETRINEKVMGAGVFPIVPEDLVADLDNSIYRKVFKANQANYSLFGKLDLQVDITRDIAQAERQYDQAKRILGISDSFQGQYDASAQSGKAKQIQVQQAAGRLQSKRQMKNAAYSEIDEIIFQYYLAYADEPRPAVYKDAQGRMQNSMFNRYDFLERDEAGEWYYNDEYLFAADASVDADMQREALWEENRKNFQQGAYGDVRLPQTLLIFWQNMEAAHYPHARDNVERLRDEIARQQELAAAQQQVAAAQQDLATERQNRASYEAYLTSLINKGGNT